MARIADKRKVLGGRGTIVLYDGGTSDGSYFYRELVPGTKTYRQKKIEGVSSMDEAEQQVFTLAVEMNSRPEMSFIETDPDANTGGKRKKREKKIEMLVGSTGRKTRSQPIEKALKRWLETEEEKCDVSGRETTRTLMATG